MFFRKNKGLKRAAFTAPFAALALLLLAALLSCGGNDPGPDSDPDGVTQVSVSPAKAHIALDGASKTRQFTATVTGTGTYAETVTWEVLGNSDEDTAIDDTGLLTVAAGETAGPGITVKATSTEDTSISGTATVTIYATSDDLPLPTGVTISPTSAAVAKGDTRQFSAEVQGEGALPDVTWSIVETEGKDADTTIDEDTGLLTVAADETLDTLTVKVESDVTASVSATAVVTLVDVNPTVPVALEGEWDSGYDVYTITETTLSHGPSFAGTIKHVAELDGEPSGVIVIQYTTAPDGAEVGNYTAVYFNRDPDGKILDFADATDYTATPTLVGEWEMYPPVNESDIAAAITNFTSGDYLDKYIYGGEWSAYAPYYRADYIPPEIAGLNQSVFSSGAYYTYDASIGGYYVDRFTVDSATKTFRYYIDTTAENYWGGTIERFTPQAGTEPARLIIKVTEVEGDDWYQTPAVVGQYLAYAYKNPAGGIVSASTPNKTGGKNTGVGTIAEALSEYTVANSYYEYWGTYNTYPAIPDTSGIEGHWLEVGDMEGMGYNVNVSGNTYLEWMDTDDDTNLVYDPDEDADMSAVCGIIVECSDTSQSSGMMYVQIAAAYMHTPIEFAAIAWRAKDSGDIEFATGSESFYSLDAAKAEYDDPSDYVDANFYTYAKQ